MTEYFNIYRHILSPFNPCNWLSKIPHTRDPEKPLPLPRRQRRAHLSTSRPRCAAAWSKRPPAGCLQPFPELRLRPSLMNLENLEMNSPLFLDFWSRCLIQLQIGISLLLTRKSSKQIAKINRQPNHSLKLPKAAHRDLPLISLKSPFPSSAPRKSPNFLGGGDPCGFIKNGAK